MKVYQGIESFKRIEKAVVTTGTFDGVHIGHRSILKRLKEVARKINGESVLLTFYPHPRMVLQSDTDLKLINTIEEKIDLLEKEGVDHLIIHPFTRAFSRTSSMEFVRDILVNRIGTKKLVIGYDHHFGRNREGSFEHLKEFGPLYGFEVEEIPAQDVDDVNVSSTKVRKAILEGNIIAANEYLGRLFDLRGVVVHGNKVGRSLGFPTANIQVENTYKLIPANGVYAVKCWLKKHCYLGMLNIGVRPTFENDNNRRSIEVHLFDFEAEIYGEEVILSFVGRTREERKFESVEELKRELESDKSKALAVLK